MDLQIKSISLHALAQFSSLIHPALPPLQTNGTFARQKALRVGGSIGDEEDLLDGADEFAPNYVVLKEAGEEEEEEEMVIDDEEEMKEVEVKKGFPSSGFGAGGFHMPMRPVIVTSTIDATTEEEDVFIPTPVAASSFIVAPVRPTAKVIPQKSAPKKAVVEQEEGEEDSDDDMPEIDMGSDDE